MNWLTFLLPAAFLVLGPTALAAPKNAPPVGVANTQKAGSNAASPPAARAASQPAPVVQDYEPSPAMWRLADADTTIYLFGTHHILPKDFRWRTARFDSVVAQAQELVVETSDHDSEQGEERIGEIMKEVIAAREPTSTKLTEANQLKWRRLAREADVPFEVFDRMPAFIALVSAGLSFSRLEGSLHEHGVETLLEAQFAEAKKPVLSIEDSIAVMGALLRVEEGPMIEQIEADLSGWDGQDIEGLFSWSEDGGETALSSEHDWARGRLTPVFSAEELREPAMRLLYDVLLTDRNRAWAQWLDDRLTSPGVVLVAVGAGHFEGEDSVLRFLAERGLTVERVQ